MKSQWIYSILIAGILLLCTIPAVQAEDSTNLTNQAVILVHSGSTNYDRIIDIIDLALAINSTDFGNRIYAYELKSYAQIQLKNYTGALATIDDGLIYEETTVLWNNRGYVFYLEGNYSDAVEAYTRALKINPTDTVTLINKGNALMELGRYAEAVDDFTKAFASDDGTNALSVTQKVKTWNNLGLAYYKLGKYSESKAAYENALALEPGNVTTKAGLAQAEQQAQNGTILTIVALIAVLVIAGSVFYYVMRNRKAEEDSIKRPSRKSKK